MRVFIGFFPSKEVKDHLYDVQRNVKGNLAKINFISKKNLHVTYKFLGNVSEEKLNDVKNVLESLKFKKFKPYTSNLQIKNL